MEANLVADPGVYRPGAVYIGGSDHRPLHARVVPSLVGNLFHWIHHDGQAQSSVLRIARTHHMLRAVHTFVDGNGRTARFIPNPQICGMSILRSSCSLGGDPRYD
ncbi:MAG: Fic family protein [Roseiflexaceae bacterium]|nr:Fic family protein [Roseiflexaceae bacterium]